MTTTSLVIINIVGGIQTGLGYLRGSKALKFQIDMLLKRQSDDPYIPKLRDKQLELERLSALKLTPANFNPYSQDGDVIGPGYLVKPKRQKILALSLAMGLMLGVFAAFFAEFLVKVRESDGESQTPAPNT